MDPPTPPLEDAPAQTRRSHRAGRAVGVRHARPTPEPAPPLPAPTGLPDSQSSASAVPAPLLQTLYDFLSTSLTPAPAGEGDAISEAARSHLSLLLPGTPLCRADFANPWSPANPEGDLLAAERFAQLTDAVPTLTAVHVENGLCLDRLYGQLVCSDIFSDPNSVAPPAKSVMFLRGRFFAARRPPDQAGSRPEAPARAAPPAARRIQRADLSRLRMLSPAQILLQGVGALPPAVREAFKLLYRETVEYDDAGARIHVLGSSLRYEEYRAHKLRYESAALRLMAINQSLDACEPSVRQEWETQAGLLARSVEQLRQLVMTAEAKMIEAAVCTRDAASARGGNVGVFFDAARLHYELTKRRGVLNPYAYWHASQAFPGNWLDRDAEYAEARIAPGPRHTQETSPRHVISPEKEEGLWRLGTEQKGGWTARGLSPRTRDLRISFGFQRVQIVRPWLQSMLLHMGSWSQPGQKRNGYSTGSIEDNTGSFPLLPTAMLVARDVEVTAAWSDEDRAVLQSGIGEGNRLALGPFVLSGSYGSGAKEYRVASTLQEGTVRVPGLQLIGWIGEVVPACPPLDG